MLRKTGIFAESWNIAYRKKMAGTILDDKVTPFHVIPNAFRYWAADPFVVERDGEVYIFAELFDYVLRRGVLGYCTLTGKKAEKWKPVIQEEYHLSYPCLMERDGKIYIMPESGAGECLTIYEEVSFPDKWQKRQILRSDVKFADTTPFPWEHGHIALTHCVNNPHEPRLTIIDLDGMAADTEVAGAIPFRSRPAGHVFEKDGKWIRPAQYSEDCGKGYGKALIFCEGYVSDDRVHHESEIAVLYPKELCFDRTVFLDGTHTYNSCEGYEVIDIKTRRFNILDFAMRIKGKILKRLS